MKTSEILRLAAAHVLEHYAYFACVAIKYAGKDDVPNSTKALALFAEMFKPEDAEVDNAWWSEQGRKRRHVVVVPNARAARAEALTLAALSAERMEQYENEQNSV